MPTHGSMTKAGKVRKQTPKIPGKERKSLPPRVKNRARYLKLLQEATARVPGRRR